ncbi:phospho-sugar mutase [Promicromonospora iranensis]|uniref:Phosphomannomutase n=1 Tax=Promicromonospora iranensis TaxID=1105144 RepID=A0ABU2CL56_9MICO|nr:phospho-sugar mutase [Promicromonospora iranensis]MDR7382048.1 phosphomannomutase [Promicromonospora iranensis]
MSANLPTTATAHSAPDLVARAEAWMAADVDAADVTELRNLVARTTDSNVGELAVAELADRFSGLLQFGTAGLRGTMAAGPNRMNRAVVIAAAAGLAAFLTKEIDRGTPRVVVGFDARYRSAEFARDTAAVLVAAGAEVLLMPAPGPTPVLAFAVRHLAADAGVMVTASHNPAADNGYKVYLGGRVVTDAGQGAQIVPPYDALIAGEIALVRAAKDVPRAESGWTVLGQEITEAYHAAVATLHDDEPRNAFRIVTTSLHGVGGAAVARVLAEAGFDDVVPVEEQAEPDPDFPTVAFPNPEEPGAIDMALALAQGAHAHLVIANDPDADRCAVAVVDPQYGTYQGTQTAFSQGWRMLHGDEVGMLLGWDAAERAARTGKGGTLACSIVSSRALAAIAAHHGLAHATTLTGFKWISRTPDLVFGYEEALGYCVDPEHVRDKDGLSAAVAVAQLANRLAAEGRTLLDRLDDVARACGLHATGQLSARFDDPTRIEATMAALRTAPPSVLAGSPVDSVRDLAEGLDGLPPTDGVVLLTADDTRVIVRPSGTEPKVKCYIEVVSPVEPDASADTLSAARVAARDRLAQVQADLRAALGL